MFASTIMNQEQNSQMFESVLSVGLGNLSDTMQSDQRALTPDFDAMSSTA